RGRRWSTALHATCRSALARNSGRGRFGAVAERADGAVVRVARLPRPAYGAPARRNARWGRTRAGTSIALEEDDGSGRVQDGQPRNLSTAARFRQDPRATR